MKTVFIVQHVHELGDDHEEIKLIGVYSSRENADNAVDRLSLQPGFAQTIEGFSVNELPVDKDHWSEGFISWRSAME